MVMRVFDMSGSARPGRNRIPSYRSFPFRWDRARRACPELPVNLAHCIGFLCLASGDVGKIRPDSLRIPFDAYAAAAIIRAVPAGGSVRSRSIIRGAAVSYAHHGLVFHAKVAGRALSEARCLTPLTRVPAAAQSGCEFNRLSGPGRSGARGP